MKKLRIISLCLSLLLLTACGAQTEPAPREDNEPLRTVTDASGRQVALPEEITSVVCVGVGALRYTTYLQAQDLVVGVEQGEQTATLAKPFSYFNRERFTALPVTGDNGTTYDEDILRLAPDVIVAYLDADTADSLYARTGIPVVTIPLNEGMFDEAALTTLSLLGEVYHREDRAQELADYLLAAQADLDSRTRDVPEAEKPTVYVAGVSYKGAHGFEGTEAGYAPLAALKGNNIADATGNSGAFDMDIEQVLKVDPDYIFVDTSNLDLVKQQYAENPAFYNSLTAVKENRVFSQISFRFCATNVELALADMYYMATVIYPEAFADVDPVEKANEIFKMFLGADDFYSTLNEAGYSFGPVDITK